MIKGYVDYIGTDKISGWAISDSKSKKVKIRLLVNGETISEIDTSKLREDINSLFNSEGSHGFEFSKDLFKDVPLHKLNKITIEASTGDVWQPLKKAKKGVNPQYRSFSDAPGASNSYEKFLALNLEKIQNASTEISNKPLNGLSILDIGCNEGYFCNAAKKLGASFVTGIDSNAEYIAKAKLRFPDVEFINCTWWEIPKRKYDVILFLSAIHYEKNQKSLLNFLHDHLKPNGTLILECGVGPGNLIEWHTIVRFDGTKKYPTFKLLQQQLLERFTIRHVGTSIMQKGDPVERHVFHCSPRTSTALLIEGPSNTGKSNLAFQLSTLGLPTTHIDNFLEMLVDSNQDVFMPIIDLAGRADLEIAKKKGMKILIQFIQEKGLIDNLLDILLTKIYLEAELFVIEGQAIENEEFKSGLIQKLSNQGIRIWSMTNARYTHGA